MWFYCPSYSAADGCTQDHREEPRGIRFNKADRRCIAVCANSGGGDKALYLPEKCDVFDALTNEKLATAVDRYDYDAQHKETFLFPVQKV